MPLQPQEQQARISSMLCIYHFVALVTISDNALRL